MSIKSPQSPKHTPNKPATAKAHIYWSRFSTISYDFFKPRKHPPMEAAAKRKRCGDDGEVDGKRRKDDGPGTATATDDEVEEFFAILRRIHVAAN